MDIDQLTANVTGFFQTHLLVSLAALAVVAYCFYRSPKESFKFLVVVGFLAIAGYFVLQLGSSTNTGVSSKSEMSNKSKKALGE